jgi:alpha-mannosidase
MTARELILLSPYHLPAQNPLMLASEDSAAFLNGLSALWHPAALLGAVAPPRVASPYDYEQPVAGHIYAVPESPPLILPDDWEQRVRDEGAIAFQATPDRAATLANLLDALRTQAGDDQTALALLGLGPESTGPFFGIGFGHRMIETLFEAMEHESTLAGSDFWREVQAAVAALTDAGAEAWRPHLQSAADRLLSAREVLYPVNIYLLDICLVDPEHLEEPFPSAFDRESPLNVIAPAALLERLAQEHPHHVAALRQRLESNVAEVCGGPRPSRIASWEAFTNLRLSRRPGSLHRSASIMRRPFFLTLGSCPH